MASYLSLGALVVSGLAAILGVRAATIVVRNNVDEFINDLQRQGRWASAAAVAAAIATALQAAQHFAI
jgi:hypothetical protein